ncbi:MAG: hypothetical protein M3409_01175 [Gemmatimonadota bacterium]|jgi:hypothetical protein|nr:hypothetical protein [Gemmatimonadota bacterium]
MAYAVIHFVEHGEPKATLVRTVRGNPTGPDGVMDPLSALIEESSEQMLLQGSPGALYMAQRFVQREQEAGRPIRVLGGKGPLGILADEVAVLRGSGFLYEVSFGREGERSVPGILQRPISAPAA